MDTWRDHKRYLWLVALLMPLLPFLAVGLFAATDMAVWLWLGPIVILGVVPVIDVITGIDRASPPDDVIEALERDRYYRWITYLFLPLQYAGFATAFWFIARGGMSVWEQVGLAVTVGFIGGLGINTAHELGHKKESNERWLSTLRAAGWGRASTGSGHAPSSDRCAVHGTLKSVATHVAIRVHCESATTFSTPG
jgi:alkane 1-monooxygenase